MGNTRTSRGYWAVAGALVVVGIVGAASIGLPFLVAGLLLVVAGLTDWRHRSPATFWATAVGFVTFTAAWFAVGPAWCEVSEATGSVGAATATGTCRSLLGVTSPVDGAEAGVAAAAGLAVVAVLVTLRVVDRRGT